MVITPKPIPKLYPLLSYWRRQLRLQDWSITIKYGRSRDLVNSKGEIPWGAMRFNSEHRSAEVMILHPEDYDNNKGRKEIEETVVHELLHIYFGGVQEEDRPYDHTAEEVAINTLSEVLVKLRRQAKKKEDRKCSTKSTKK